MRKQELQRLERSPEARRAEVATPYTALLDGQGSGWGDGRKLVCGTPSAVLWVQSDNDAVWHEGSWSRRCSGHAFDLFEQFCLRFLGEEADGRQVVVAIAYEAGRAANFLPPWPGHGRWPLLVAAAYERSEAFEEVSQSRPGHASNQVASAGSFARSQPPMLRGSEQVELRPKWNAAQHRSAVCRVLNYIAAGDVYQVNIAYPWRCEKLISATALFERLQEQNPVPFGAYFRCGSLELVVNSPECLLRRRGSRIETCPIKGTRPRGSDGAQDRTLREELLADPKEQAELVMIVDLERNDLGRVCEPGSVEVVEHARLRSFAHWHHLESKIQGRLRAGVGWSALLAALFPGGSVTGAPKRRAMQIIDEIEAEPRGFYTGALGWLRSRRDADFALTIRTAVIDSSGLAYWTGGGIVADSDPQTEFEETQVKALAMRAALHGK